MGEKLHKSSVVGPPNSLPYLFETQFNFEHESEHVARKASVSAGALSRGTRHQFFYHYSHSHIPSTHEPRPPAGHHNVEKSTFELFCQRSRPLHNEHIHFCQKEICFILPIVKP